MKDAYIIESSDQSMREVQGLIIVNSHDDKQRKITYFRKSDILFKSKDANPVVVFPKEALRKAYRGDLFEEIMNELPLVS